MGDDIQRYSIGTGFGDPIGIRDNTGKWVTYKDHCAEVERLTHERDAYKKAKQENDERFMNERDEARNEVERLKEENSKLREAVRWAARYSKYAEPLTTEEWAQECLHSDALLFADPEHGRNILRRAGMEEGR